MSSVQLEPRRVREESSGTSLCYRRRPTRSPRRQGCFNVLRNAKRLIQLAASYGELLPEGVTRMSLLHVARKSLFPFRFDAKHLDAAHATSLVDLGAGVGKLVLQAFLQFPNLQSVVWNAPLPDMLGRVRSASS
jgi:hypothetical protein